MPNFATNAGYLMVDRKVFKTPFLPSSLELINGFVINAAFKMAWHKLTYYPMTCNDYPLWFKNAHATARFTEFFLSRFGFFYKTCGNKKRVDLMITPFSYYISTVPPSLGLRAFLFS